MGESEIISVTRHPVTTTSLVRDLASMGIERGDTLIVHSSLRSLGWVVGGAAAVVDAFRDVVGPEGTITMPSHSGDWSDPSNWGNPPVPREWWDQIVGERPPFDPYSTPLRGMGAIPANLLMRRETLRSAHPLHSHMAMGSKAAFITERHPLDDSFGDSSPLGRLYTLDAKVVLIGVGHENNTALHLAEARASWPGKRLVEFRSTVATDGSPHIVTWNAFDPDSDDFGELGSELELAGLVRIGRMGEAVVRVAVMRQIVDAAVPMIESRRGAGRSAPNS